MVGSGWWDVLNSAGARFTICGMSVPRQASTQTSAQTDENTRRAPYCKRAVARLPVGTVRSMAHRMAKIVGIAAGAVGLVGAVLALSAGGDEPLSPAAEAVADLPTVTDFLIRAETDGCAFDQDRGGLVYEGLTIESKSTGVLELSFYVQRDSLDNILPGYVSTVLTFDEDSPSHTFDLVVPVTQDEYEAGYDECHWSTGEG